MLAWGSGGSGRLGLGDTDERLTPVVIPNDDNITAIVTGESYSVALKDDGSMLAWGGNYYGQLGLGETVNQELSPVTIPNVDNITAIATGDAHTMALKDDGSLLTWGDNGYGQLGVGDRENRYLPALIAGVDNLDDIAAGWDNSIGIKNDGTLLAWGRNHDGSLGLGDTADRKTPVAINEHGAGKIFANNIAISLGGYHANTIQDDGTLWSWGNNSEGYLALGDNAARTTATSLNIDYNITTIAAGAIALKDDGSLLVWGNNYNGQLGLGNIEHQYIPVAIPELNNIIAVSAKGSSTIALKSDGTMLAWGSNRYGQLGLGNTTEMHTPTAVPNESNISAISSGGIYTIALKDDGTLLSWGNNYYGQLGLDDNTSDRLVPTVIMQDDNVTAINNIIAIQTGSAHALAIKTDGTLLAWGSNRFGQLGDGSTTQRNRPVEVSGAIDIIAVAAGDFHTIALKGDGTLLTWGRNLYGQLGLGESSTYITTTPVTISGVDNVIAIAAENDFTIVLKSDGTLLVWGYNNGAELGLGDNINRFSPEVVREFKALTLLNTAPTVNINTGASLQEGSSDIITSAKLDYNDDTSPDTEIIYTVTTNVINGELKLNGVTLVLDDTFTQDDINSSRVTYVHDGTDTLSDSFIFKVTDGDAQETVDQTFNFTIIPVDDLDTDGDGIIDSIDEDDDNDGMSDVYELQYAFDPIDPSDADLDADEDGFTNLEEYNAGTNPRDDQDKPVYMNPAIIMYLLN